MPPSGALFRLRAAGRRNPAGTRSGGQICRDPAAKAAPSGDARTASQVATIRTNSRNTAEELAPLALSDRELDFACVSALEARLALVRSGGASAIVDMDLRALGPLVKVLGGGAGEWAAEGWRERPDFWKEIA